MDFPLFHLDFVGNRMLIAVIAIIHVLINHALAVGFIPVVTLLEYFGYRDRKKGLETAVEWDEAARKMLFVAFVVTTSFGALTGVGIWFSAALISPESIGSLIRVFFMAWFVEWIVFVLEVIFIMIYFLSWTRFNASLKDKLKHVRIGLALSIFSWLTMAIIVGILGFMMDTGNWLSDKTLIDGFANPIYIPQLFFRTPLALVAGAAFALLLAAFFVKKESEARPRMFRLLSFWMFIWTPHVIAAGLYYYYQIPDAMVGSLPVAIATQQFQNWYDLIVYFLFGTIVFSMIVALYAFILPRNIPKVVIAIPLLATLLTLGWFERVREFIRKPYVIEEYMYSNMIRIDSYPLLKRDGMLKHAAYTSVTEITDENKIEAGKNVFVLSCSRCHTTDGINSIVTKFEDMLMLQGKPLEYDRMLTYIPMMHKGRYYMPPFPGNKAEMDALVRYIQELQKHPREIEGAQDGGVQISPLQTY